MQCIINARVDYSIECNFMGVHSKSMDIYYSNLTGHPSAAIPQIIVPITKDM